MERSDFVKNGLAAAASGPSLANVSGVNDRICIGQIGCGGRGHYELMVCSRNPGVEVGAVADVYKPLVDRAVQLTKQEIIGDPEVQQLLTKPYRAPWLLPKA